MGDDPDILPTNGTVTVNKIVRAVRMTVGGRSRVGLFDGGCDLFPVLWAIRGGCGSGLDGHQATTLMDRRIVKIFPVQQSIVVNRRE